MALSKWVCRQYRSALLSSARSHIANEERREVSNSNVAVNHAFKLDSSVERELAKGTYKHKAHPGIVQLRNTHLPEALQNAISIFVERHPLKELKEKSQELAHQLWSRRLPPTEQDLYQKIAGMEAEILANKKVDDLSEVEQEVLEAQVRKELLPQVRRKIYHWKAIDYTAYTCVLYLVARMSFDFSVLRQIFGEIKMRLGDYQPKTMFDFGSGVGSAIWAANAAWPNSLAEHYCVDTSADMNTLARLLLQGGEEENKMCFPGVYFRQFFPPSLQNKYNLVVSAFSLTELDSQAERLKSVLALWRKTQDLLVIVENGTNAGFKAVMEAREFILQLGAEYHDNQSGTNECLEGHVFMPCPHSQVCPRLQRDDGTPCNFQAQFDGLVYIGSDNMGSERVGANKERKKVNSEMKKANYSYVVLRKGAASLAGAMPNWPRIVRTEKKASKMVHLEMCTPSSQLQQCVVTAKKQGKDLYWCARASRWGDLLPAHDVSSQKAEAVSSSFEDLTAAEEMNTNRSHQMVNITQRRDDHENDLNSEHQSVLS